MTCLFLRCFRLDVLQAFVMVGSVILVAVLGVIKVGGATEVVDRAIEGGRIFSPMFVFQPLMQATAKRQK